MKEQFWPISLVHGNHAGPDHRHSSVSLLLRLWLQVAVRIGACCGRQNVSQVCESSLMYSDVMGTQQGCIMPPETAAFKLPTCFDFHVGAMKGMLHTRLVVNSFGASKVEHRNRTF